MVGKRRATGRNSKEGKAMSAQDDEKTEDKTEDAKTEDEQDAKSSDEHDADNKDMSEIGQVSGDAVADEPSDEGKEEVKKIAEAYGDKKTAVMPGTDRTITGTAVNDWLDDEGNPKFGDPDEHPFAEDDQDDDDDTGGGDSENSADESKESADQD
jgi:hypothetical protein